MFDSLSSTQREIVFEKEGKFVVRACPGSGKTFTVSAKIAHVLGAWESKYTGIAALSFTNVAWKEIKSTLASKFSNTEINYHPHFIGTLDSFINQYIFLPFGHLILKCGKRPILVGEPHGSWSGGNSSTDYAQYFDRLSIDIDGNMFYYEGTSFFFRTRQWESHRDGMLQMKKRILRAGYANQGDANYFALRLLRKFPSIATSLVKRFPFLIVDEAQDTTEIQMEILNLLVNNRLENLMVVGDPDQAIFEWNSARPDVFNAKFAEWQSNSIVLNENRRSTQAICDCTYHLSTLGNPSQAVNPNGYPDIPPSVVVYSDVQTLTSEFLALCEQHSIPVSEKTVAVVFRSKSFLYEIKQLPVMQYGSSIWVTDKKYCYDILLGKFLCAQDQWNEGIELIERGVVKCINNSDFCSKEDIKNAYDKKGGFTFFRKRLYEFVKTLPSISDDSTLGDWINTANNQLTGAGFRIQLYIDSSAVSYTFQQIFPHIQQSSVQNPFYAGTIHSVKGETYDAVLIILKKGCGTRKLYRNLLNQVGSLNAKEQEELRMVYVGMTRPRRFLMIGVPDDQSREAWASFLSFQ